MKNIYNRILLNTDASDGGSVDNILDFDPSKVDRSMPLLKEGLHDLSITTIEKAVNEKTQKTSIKVVLGTTIEERDTNGSVLNVGFPIFHYFGITPSDKYTVKQIQANLANFLDSVFGKNTNESLMPMDRMVGKVVTVKTENTAGDASFPASSRVKTWVPAPAK